MGERGTHGDNSGLHDRPRIEEFKPPCLIKYQEISMFVFFFYEGCLITGCARDGSCVSNEEKQTYSCVCKRPWTGQKCEVKMGK